MELVATLLILVLLPTVHSQDVQCHYYSNAPDNPVSEQSATCDSGVQHCLKLIGDNGLVFKACADPFYTETCSRLFSPYANVKSTEIYICSGNMCNGAGLKSLGLVFTVGILALLRMFL
ncbi:hypothetical protein QR680_013492 [Steinernema hermaphroditum]|uniref:UPAR/Ly6 domain-containing protein n=1 Tax=Steinernema hermaphroditum TaxID=289476 RepID=A0AA39M2L7_9BILA|nr:hypothetical protein QR680_013492 [Steinernema hermaphroditum]